MGGSIVPTKQDKFKPVTGYELVMEEEDGKVSKVTDEELYLKKKGPDSTKDFGEELKQLIRGSMSSEHPYASDIPVEVLISVDMNAKRFNEVDVDNLAKYILDCMTGLVFIDDAQVVNLYVNKDVNAFIPLHGFFIGVRQLKTKESWFSNIKFAYLEELSE